MGRDAPAEKEMVLFADGASKGNPGPSGAGVVLFDSAGTVVEETSWYIGMATNNQAEYRALILGTERAIAHGATFLKIKLDSELVVMQVQGNYSVRNRVLFQMHRRVLSLLKNLQRFEIESIPRSENASANRLAQEAADRKAN